MLAFDICELKNPFPWHLLPPILLTAISVAFIEEALFRGAILGLVRQTISTAARRDLGFRPFLDRSFFESRQRTRSLVVHWYSGFELLPHAFWKFSDPLMVLGGFTTIGILGLLLAHATIRTYSLWLGIGIHSGLIFGKMGFNKVTKKIQDVTPWFGGDITVGIGSILVLLLLWFLIWIIYLRGKSDSESCLIRCLSCSTPPIVSGVDYPQDGRHSSLRPMQRDIASRSGRHSAAVAPDRSRASSREISPARTAKIVTPAFDCVVSKLSSKRCIERSDPSI